MDGIRIEDGRGSLENRILLERGISCRARVMDIRGEPIAQARAILRDQSGELASFSSHAPSNRDGILQLPDVRAGHYRMTVLHGSYAPSSIDMMVARDSDPVTVTLSPGGKLRISVFDRQGLPVKFPEIEVLDAEGENVAEDMSLDSPLQYAMSGSDEPLVFGPLLPGSYRVAAKKGKSQSRPEKITVVEGETSEIRLSLEE